MDENTIQTPTEADATEQPTEVKPTRLQVFVQKHPRAAKVAAITGALTTLIGAVSLTKTVQSNRHHAIAAGDHAKESLDELAATVSPTDTEA